MKTILAILGILLIADSSWACEGGGKWPHPKIKVSGDLANNIQKLEKQWSIELVKSDYQTRCGTDQKWLIKDKNGKFSIELPIPRSAKSGSEINIAAMINRVNHVMRTPRADLARLTQAEKDFEQEKMDVFKDYGVLFNLAKGLPVDQQISNKGKDFVVEVSMAACENGMLDSRRVASRTVNVDAVGFYPGRQYYRQGEVFRPAQLRYKLFKERPEILVQLASQAELNAQACGKTEDFDWPVMAAKLKALAGESAQAESKPESYPAPDPAADEATSAK